MLKIETPRPGRFLLESTLLQLGALLLLLGYIAPNHYLPWASFHNEAPIFAALVLIAAGLACRHPRVSLPKATFCWLMLPALIVVVQYASGQIPYAGHALVSLLFVIGVVIAWWIGATGMLTGGRDHTLHVCAVVFAVAASLSAAVVVLQWLRLEGLLDMYAVERAPGSRPGANLAQPNLLATLLVIGTVAAASLWESRRLQTWEAVSLVVFLSFALVVTESKTGFATAVCVGLLYIVGSRTIGHRVEWRPVFVWWSTLLLIWSVWARLNELLLLQPARSLEASVDNIRLVFWKQMSAAIAKAPWAGYGWNQTATAQKFGVEAAPGEWTTDYAHNVVLDVAAWVGIPMGIVLFFAFIWWLVKVLRRLQSKPELLLLCIATPILLHSLVEFPFAYSFFLFPLAATLGALQALQMPNSFAKKPASLAWRATTAGGLALLGLICSAMAAEYLRAEEDVRIMRFELRKIGKIPPDYVPPNLKLLTQLDAMLKVGRIQPTRGMTPETLESMRVANLFFSWGTLHLNYVIALAVNGHPTEALQELRILRSLYGEATYQQAQNELRRLRRRSFPELDALIQQ